MGHRANYAILERGSVSLYYSHWGAKTVPADVFWGPSAAEAFIRSNSPTDEWLDSIWAEGGIALDKDRRRALFFGDAELLDSAEMWSLFLSLAGRVRARDGWTLDAGKGQGDLAEFCGKPRSSVEAPEAPPLAIPLSKLGENYARGFVYALIGHNTSTGFEDRVLDFALSKILLNGPELLSRLAELPTLDQVRALGQKQRPKKTVLQRLKERFIDGAPADLPEGAVWDKRAKGYTFAPPPYGEAITDFALLDETKMTIEVFDRDDAASLSGLRAAWPGWTVSPLADGIEGYFRRTGRSVPQDLTPPPPLDAEEAPVRSREECLAEIERHVFGGDEQKKHLLKVARNVKALHSEPGTVFAPGFLEEVPGLPLSEQERREIWTTLLGPEERSARL